MGDTMIVLTAPSPMMPLVCLHHMDDSFTPTILTFILVSPVLIFTSICPKIILIVEKMRHEDDIKRTTLSRNVFMKDQALKLA